MAEIKYVGLDALGLDEFSAKRLHGAVMRHAERIERLAHHEAQLVVHLKVSGKEAGRHECEAHVRVTYPGATLVSDRQRGWDALTVAQRGLDAIEDQLRHKAQARADATLPGASRSSRA